MRSGIYGRFANLRAYSLTNPMLRKLKGINLFTIEVLKFDNLHVTILCFQAFHGVKSVQAEVQSFKGLKLKAEIVEG